MTVKSKKTWRRVNSVEELVHLSGVGVRVKCDDDELLKSPRKAESVMGLSSRSLVKIINKGLMYEADESANGADDDTVLSRAQIAIRGTGLSMAQIADKVGVSRQAVGQFLSAKSVQTRVLDRYIKRTGVKI